MAPLGSSNLRGDALPLAIVLVAAVLLAMERCRQRRRPLTKSLGMRSARSSMLTAPIPREWSWSYVDKAAAERWRAFANRQIAVGEYTSPVFDQHVSNWCGCCYLISVLQMLQDRMHVTLGVSDPSVTMFPCLQYNYQLALDTFQRSEQGKRPQDWNACTGGLPTRVLRAISENTCVLRLMADATLWLGHPCTMQRDYADEERNIPIEPLEVIENTPQSVCRRILKYGPVVLGIHSGCLLDPNLSRRGGIVDDAVLGRRDHAVTVVGWRRVRGKAFWIIRNSWGTHSVPGSRPDAGCVGLDFNNCTPELVAWRGDPQKPGYAYVSFGHSDLMRPPSPWYDAIFSQLRDLLPADADEQQEWLDSPVFRHSSIEGLRRLAAI